MAPGTVLAISTEVMPSIASRPFFSSHNRWRSSFSALILLVSPAGSQKLLRPLRDPGTPPCGTGRLGGEAVEAQPGSCASHAAAARSPCREPRRAAERRWATHLHVVGLDFPFALVLDDANRRDDLLLAQRRQRAPLLQRSQLAEVLERHALREAAQAREVDAGHGDQPADERRHAHAPCVEVAAARNQMTCTGVAEAKRARLQGYQGCRRLYVPVAWRTGYVEAAEAVAEAES